MLHGGLYHQFLYCLFFPACLEGWRCVSIYLSWAIVLIFRITLAHVSWVCLCVYAHAMTCVWRLEDNWGIWFCPSGMWIVSFDGTYLYVPNYLSGTVILILNSLVICCLFLYMPFAFKHILFKIFFSLTNLLTLVSCYLIFFAVHCSQFKTLLLSDCRLYFETL